MFIICLILHVCINRRCLTAGFFMNAAELQKEGEYMSVSRLDVQ